jgi:hypothetical protein
LPVHFQFRDESFSAGEMFVVEWERWAILRLLNGPSQECNTFKWENAQTNWWLPGVDFQHSFRIKFYWEISIILNRKTFTTCPDNCSSSIVCVLCVCEIVQNANEWMNEWMVWKAQCYASIFFYNQKTSVLLYIDCT